MKRTLFSIISAFALLLPVTKAAAASEPISGDFSKASVSIKFYDRTMYYPGNSNENPIWVNVSIKNNGTETLRFKLANDRAFSVDFSAYTIKNSNMHANTALTEKRTTSKIVYFREIAIESGESYSFVENVKNYINFDEPSIYYLEMNFYPELYNPNGNKVTSNRLNLDIRPAPSASSSSVLPVESESASVLKPESISPDRVVEQTIVARQKTLWDQYFLYMDVEQMMLRNPDISRRYKNASADERSRMLSSYKTDLMQNRIDYDIVAVPETFHIETTMYSENDGTVSVIEYFKYPNFREKKRFVYKVRQRDGIWQIYDYTVTNLGTE
ncbi:MAG: hypothetical protein II921_07570 [Treponema sp.]|nr:hypothetical protein [Treponema sp.]